jgi:DNA-binding MarR family transcriptional regulator
VAWVARTDTLPGPAAPGGSAGDLAVALAAAERAVTRRLARIVEQQGCSVEAWRVLCLLADGERHPMTQLADAALLPGPSLTRLVDRLVEDNLVYRRADDRDRRCVLLYATERGLALQRQLAARIERDSEAILAGADADAVRRLVGLLAGLA